MCYGIANTIIYGNGPFHIFANMHRILGQYCPQLNELLSCFICLPWWLGFTFSFCDLFLAPNIAVTPFNVLLGGNAPWWVIMFLDGAFTSGGVWLINTIQDRIEKGFNNGE